MIQAPIVLVVDDERPVREALVRLFERAGMPALGASGLAAARRLVDRHRASLRAVTVDLRLGREDGLDLVREIGRSPGAPAVVVFSASADGPARARALALGAHDVLDKPASPSAILDAVRRVQDAPHHGAAG